jgi:hypothetical protein
MLCRDYQRRSIDMLDAGTLRLADTTSGQQKESKQGRRAVFAIPHRDNLRIG